MPENLENEIKRTYEFHKRPAPGILIGCYMVDLALEKLAELGAPAGKLNAVVETDVCLADAVQVMTGCTAGNKYLKIKHEYGRYACALYDRTTKKGVRVFVELENIDKNKHPNLYAFFTRTRDEKVLSDMEYRAAVNDKVKAEFLLLKRKALDCEGITVNLPTKEKVNPAAVCPSCGESFVAPGASGTCLYCGHGGYYTRDDRTLDSGLTTNSKMDSATSAE